ncbi:DNA glycosylase AlkZ-like family protein [Arcanobacterium phocae]|uniref:DNA glycosylase AlkZ-like family protein n=1 Tax=Arcanobacterium phocae TaxID=131112 RepID=UPI001C0EFFCF|nr:crosslink repair DNA glycosylase YcaQ family protein [Arcanobacterium phocae]
MENIDLRTARKVAVLAQGLAPSQLGSLNSLESVIQRLGCVQIDSIQAVRRSQEIVLLSRGVDKSEVDSLYTSAAGLFENWGHAHSLLPQSLWPIFHWRRDRIRKNGLSGVPYNPKVATDVLKRISIDGPATHGMLGKTRGNGWDRSSEVKVACEWLLSFGELAVVSRDERWQRVYSTPEQANMPTEEKLSVDESLQKSVDLALGALGAARLKDVYDYFRFPKDPQIAEYCHESRFIPVNVEGLKDTWLIDEQLLDKVDELDWSSPHISVLSPFDSLIWHRPRQLALFGKDYRLEIYKPANKREFGYFAMPLLNNENIIGRVAARVSNGTVKIENLEIDETMDARFVEHEVARTLQLWTDLPEEGVKL